MADGIFYTLGLDASSFVGPVKQSQEVVGKLNSATASLEVDLTALASAGADSAAGVDAARKASAELTKAARVTRDAVGELNREAGEVPAVAERASAGVKQLGKASEEATDQSKALTRAIRDQTVELDALQGSSKVSAGAMARFRGSQGAATTGMGVMISKFRGAIGPLAILVGTLNGAAAAMRRAAGDETTAAAFETLVGSATKAQGVISDLRKLGASTPLEFPELADAGRNLIAFGEGADTVTETLRRIGDVATGVQAPIGQIAEIYGKARVQQTLFAEDINQLVGRGIPVITQFARQLGVSEAEVKKLASEGKISFANLEQAFKDLTSEGGQFFGMMAKQGETMKGLLSSLTDNLGDVLSQLGRPINDSIRPLLRGAVSLADQLSTAVRNSLDGMSLDDHIEANRKAKIEAQAAARAAEEKAEAEAAASVELQRQNIAAERQVKIQESLAEIAKRRAALLKQAQERRDSAMTSAQERIYEVTLSEEDNLKRKIKRTLDEAYVGFGRGESVLGKREDLKSWKDLASLFNKLRGSMSLEGQERMARRLEDLIDLEEELREVKESAAEKEEREKKKNEKKEKQVKKPAERIGRQRATAAEKQAAEKQDGEDKRIRLYDRTESLRRRFDRMHRKDRGRGFTALDLRGARFEKAAAQINATGAGAVETAKPAKPTPNPSESEASATLKAIRSSIEGIEQRMEKIVSA